MISDKIEPGRLKLGNAPEGDNQFRIHTRQSPSLRMPTWQCGCGESFRYSRGNVDSIRYVFLALQVDLVTDSTGSGRADSDLQHVKGCVFIANRMVYVET